MSGFVPFLQISQEILGRNGDPTPLSQAGRRHPIPSVDGRSMTESCSSGRDANRRQADFYREEIEQDIEKV